MLFFSYRVSRHDCTKFSPFYLVYGRNARLPVDINLKGEENGEEDVMGCHQREKEKFIVAEVGDKEEGLEESLYVRTQAMIDIRKKALENIEVAQTRQKRYYDAKHSKDKSCYKVGALVLVKNARKLTRKGSKLEPNWTGPYQIAEVVGRGTFRLCHQDDNSKVLSTIYIT